MVPLRAASACLVALLVVATHGTVVALAAGAGWPPQQPRQRHVQQRASLLGDPGMRADVARVETEGWNFCNQAGPHAKPSPRYADCLGTASTVAAGHDHDWAHAPTAAAGVGPGPDGNLVTRAMNALTPPAPIPGAAHPTNDTDVYARQKEVYLGNVCRTPAATGARGAAVEVAAGATPWWSFWNLMAKSGNIDHGLGWCPATESRTPAAGESGAIRVPPVTTPAHILVSTNAEAQAWQRWRRGTDDDGRPPMNQPVVFHDWTQPGACTPTHPITGAPLDLSGASGVWSSTTSGDFVVGAGTGQRTMCGSFWGSWDVDAPAANASSKFSTVWYRPPAGVGGSTVWHHSLTCSKTYPWLMWYQRADSVGVNGGGGYPWEGRGVLLRPFTAAEDVSLTVFLNITATTSGQVQFYLPEMGGCWKVDGSPCDGDLTTDITHYVCFTINPHKRRACSATSQGHCPPTHTFANGTVVSSHNTAQFPYECYYYYCAPPGDDNTTANHCDPYSNPNQQEIMQILPCSEWQGLGFPTKRGQGWLGDGGHWTLNVTGLARRLYVSGDAPARHRRYVSMEVGPEMPDPGQQVDWVTADWDVTVAL